ncbi:MAG: DUF1653 domain-containing protein [Breznakibacter sp.]|nr:DUF1653 domain-containing protein [Breznakibacter sp.]
MNIKLGLYQHFKGHRYVVNAIARHSESLEEYVVYTRENNPDDVWIRPATMFLEDVEVNGVVVKRFTFLGDI